MGAIGVIREAEAMMNIRQVVITVIIREIQVMGTTIKCKPPGLVRQV